MAAVQNADADEPVFTLDLADLTINLNIQFYEIDKRKSANLAPDPSAAEIKMLQTTK